MSKTISQRGGTIVADLDHTGGLTAKFPAFPIPGITIPINGGPACSLYCAFTPSASTVSINETGENAITFTGATAREYVSSAFGSITEGHFFAATAQRKPGSTGDIAAQTVVVYQEVGGTDDELGRFNVEAALAGANPVCGFFVCANVVGEERIGITDITITCTSDADLEIQLWIIGVAS